MFSDSDSSEGGEGELAGEKTGPKAEGVSLLVALPRRGRGGAFARKQVG